jgi:uracil-DNA glycosylase
MTVPSDLGTGAVRRVDPRRDAPGATWDDLVDLIAGCTACPELAEVRRRTVPGVRPACSDLLLIGEAPGAAEDEVGVPFVGRAGQLLDRLLAEAGLDRRELTVVNVLKCRPPRNRTPTHAEAARCRPWLDRQIELADPALVVTLGGVAASWALGRGTRLGASRGVVHQVEGRPLVVTYHPSAALRFGPNGAPMAALREDLAFVHDQLLELRRERAR